MVSGIIWHSRMEGRPVVAKRFLIGVFSYFSVYAQGQVTRTPVRTAGASTHVAQPIASFEGEGAALSLQGDKVAFVRGHTLYVIDLRTGKEFLVSEPDINRVFAFRALEFSTDGKKLLFQGNEGGFTRAFPSRIYEIPVTDAALFRYDKMNHAMIASARGSHELIPGAPEKWDALGVKRLTNDDDLAGSPQDRRRPRLQSEPNPATEDIGTVIYRTPYLRQYSHAIYYSPNGLKQALVTAGVNNETLRQEIWIGLTVTIEGRLAGWSASGDRLFVITERGEGADRKPHLVSVNASTGRQDGQFDLPEVELVGRVLGSDEFLVRSWSGSEYRLESAQLGPVKRTTPLVLPAVPASAVRKGKRSTAAVAPQQPKEVSATEREAAARLTVQQTRVDLVQVALNGSILVCWNSGSLLTSQMWIEVYPPGMN